VLTAEAQDRAQVLATLVVGDVDVVAALVRHRLVRLVRGRVLEAGHVLPEHVDERGLDAVGHVLGERRRGLDDGLAGGELRGAVVAPVAQRPGLDQHAQRRAVVLVARPVHQKRRGVGEVTAGAVLARQQHGGRLAIARDELHHLLVLRQLVVDDAVVRIGGRGDHDLLADRREERRRVARGGARHHEGRHHAVAAVAVAHGQVLAHEAAGEAAAQPA
jgi:hypothetical protein